MVAAPSSGQGKRWDGADNQPVSPLPCGTGGGAEAAATMAGTMAAAPAYNGGTPKNAPDLAGKPITLVDVPKLVGIGYFAATTKGEGEAAKELGNVTVSTDGPATGDIQKQVAVIENYLTGGRVNGILFASNDPVQIAPTLRKALANGLYVVGYDADAQPDARQWFVNQAAYNAIAKGMVDSMHAEIGDATFAIVTSAFTAPNQGRWVAEMQAYQEKCYPGMKWLETIEEGENQNMATQRATTLIGKYGSKMKGMFAMSSTAFPGVAEAVAQAKLCPVDAADAVKAPSKDEAISVVGLSTPNSMKPYVTGKYAGCVKSVVLWNPVDLGYAAVYVMRATVDGKLKPGDTEVDAGRLGKLKIVNGSEVLLGPPFIYTKDNIDKFDF
jgi:rhamnose transport system substrate-binding protein